MPKTDMSVGGGVGGGGYGAFQGGHMSAHDMALGQATQQQQGHSLQLTNHAHLTGVLSSRVYSL